MTEPFCFSFIFMFILLLKHFPRYFGTMTIDKASSELSRKLPSSFLHYPFLLGKNLPHFSSIPIYIVINLTGENKYIF